MDKIFLDISPTLTFIFSPRNHLPLSFTSHLPLYLLLPTQSDLRHRRAVATEDAVSYYCHCFFFTIYFPHILPANLSHFPYFSFLHFPLPIPFLFFYRWHSRSRTTWPLLKLQLSTRQELMNPSDKYWQVPNQPGSPNHVTSSWPTPMPLSYYRPPSHPLPHAIWYRAMPWNHRTAPHRTLHYAISSPPLLTVITNNLNSTSPRQLTYLISCCIIIVHRNIQVSEQEKHCHSEP